MSELLNTNQAYDIQIGKCRSIFLQKNTDYGTAWRILRPRSVTDQIFIKAQRIKSIETYGKQKIDESIANEYIGIINYAIIAILNIALKEDEIIKVKQLLNNYDQQITLTKQLMMDKNHDYGEAWRSMRVSTFTDLILMKILRTKQIEDNDGKTLISEGVEANYRDMINYAIFALIRLDENSTVFASK